MHNPSSLCASARAHTHNITTCSPTIIQPPITRGGSGPPPTRINHFRVPVGHGRGRGRVRGARACPRASPFASFAPRTPAASAAPAGATGPGAPAPACSPARRSGSRRPGVSRAVGRGVEGCGESGTGSMRPGRGGGRFEARVADVDLAARARLVRLRGADDAGAARHPSFLRCARARLFFYLYSLRQPVSCVAS